MFKIRGKSESLYLPDEQAVAFCHTTEQLLYIALRCRIDIQTTVAFLTTRVKKPDKDDWMKLKRCLKYLKGKKHMKITIIVDSISILKWWVDVSYNTHDDYKGHTRAMMTLGEVAVTSLSNKQKFNIKISTEGEFVGADDALGQVIWKNALLKDRDMPWNTTRCINIIDQPCYSKKNGRGSSRKRTKHINARYYIIKDTVDRGDLKI